MMKQKYFMIFLSIFLLFSACDEIPFVGIPSGDGPVTGLILIDPLDGQHLPLGEMVDVKSAAGEAPQPMTVSLLVNSEPYRLDEFTDGFLNAEVYQPWTPRAPGAYTLQTMLGETASNIITVYVESPEEKDQAEEPPEDASDEPLEEPEDAIEEAVEAECPPVNAVSKGYPFCRSGPGTSYSEVTNLKLGQTVSIMGVSSSGSWWQVAFNKSGDTCWVWGVLLEINEDTDCVPVSTEKEKNEDVETPVEETTPGEEPGEEAPADPAPPLHPTKDPGTGPTTS